MWLRKGKFQEKKISPNSSTKQRKKNHIKARMDKTQENNKCRLCCDRDETINHIIVGKVFHREMYKKFNLTIPTNGICTTHHLSKKLTHINSYGTLTYTRIT